MRKAVFVKDGDTCNIDLVTDCGDIRLVMTVETIDSLFSMLDCKMKAPPEEDLEKLLEF